MPDRGALLDALMREVTSEDYDILKSTFGAALWLSANPDRAYAWGQVLTEHTSPGDADVVPTVVFLGQEHVACPTCAGAPDARGARQTRIAHGVTHKWTYFGWAVPTEVAR